MIRNLLVPALRDVLGALSRRAGVSLSAFLLANGVPPDHVDQALLSLGVLAALSFDVAVSLYYRRKIDAP